MPPYEASLLFPAAQSGNVDAVDLLLERGLDVNYREKGDNSYAMHWVAAQGNLEMVRELADAGGDVIGEGDDHALGVIGWASCWKAAATMRTGQSSTSCQPRCAPPHLFGGGDESRRRGAEDCDR